MVATCSQPWCWGKATHSALLDCYWVGSLDFNFLGNQGPRSRLGQSKVQGLQDFPVPGAAAAADRADLQGEAFAGPPMALFNFCPGDVFRERRGTPRGGGKKQTRGVYVVNEWFCLGAWKRICGVCS